MMHTIVGMGIYYDALRRQGSGSPVVVQCKGDDDRPEDVREAYAEQRAVDDYIASLPTKYNNIKQRSNNGY
jgi:hypothetical protein